MITLFIVVTIVSGALVIGALWGLYGTLPTAIEGFLVAMAGGALIVSLMTELIQPASEHISVITLSLCIAAGAVTFTVLDWMVEKYTASDDGGGLLLAITADGVPENLALGVALIGAGATEVAALAGSIFLSNLPEAAGGAKEMRSNGIVPQKILWMWIGTAAMLSASAIIGNLALRSVSEDTIAAIRCVAAGAVVASLATEIFPQAYKEDHKATGIAVALGLILAFALSQLSA